MPRNIFYPAIILLMLIAIAVPMMGTAQAESNDEMKSLIIISGYGGYSAHELDKAASFRDHLLESCSTDDMVYLTDTGRTGSDGIATISNVENAFQWLIDNSGSDTKLSVYIMDHVSVINSQTHFRFEDGTISASSIDNWLDQVTCSEMTVILNGEKSALAGPDLDASSRDVICSMKSDQNYCPDNFDIARSLADEDADANDDGIVSYIEAFENEKVLIENTGQVPVLY